MNESMEHEGKVNETVSVFLKEVDPIEESSGASMNERSDLRKVIEAPLLKACSLLYDKNIRTVASSANKKDLMSGRAYILIDFDNLSKKNKEITQTISNPISYGNTNVIEIDIPINETTRVEEVEKAALSIVSKFEKQPMTWARVYSLEDVNNIFGIRDMGVEEAKKATGFYYDKKSKLFYESEEQFRKATEQF